MADPQIRIIVGELNRLGERAVKQLTLEATAELIEATPVDTGWARANWVPRIGAPELVPQPGVSDPSAVNSRRGQQQSSLAAVATGYKLSQGSVFISNNVPYITRLNDGSSQQAPSGFVQQAIQRAVNTVARRPL